MIEDSPFRAEPLQSPADRTFPRSSRLTRSAQFQRVFGSGTRFGNGVFTIRVAPSESGRPRLGLAVSRKCARLAVQRHRIKRIVRESFRHQRSALPPMDYVVMCAPGAAHLSNSELSRTLRGLWKRSVRLAGVRPVTHGNPSSPESGSSG